MEKEKKWRVFGAMVETTPEHCYYCKDPVDEYSRTVDHLIPESRGGIKANKNKVYSCRDCNQLKDDMTPEEFQQHLERLVRMLQSHHKKQVNRLKKIKVNTKLLIESKNGNKTKVDS
jgi:hypothetical protein